MKREETERLISKYLEGTTTPEEEARIAQEVNQPDAPLEWKAIATMLGNLTLDEATYDKEMARRRSRTRWTHRIWAIAASIVVDTQTNMAIAYVDGQTITDEDRVLAIAEDAVCDIFSNSDAEESLYEIFNPEE